MPTSTFLPGKVCRFLLLNSVALIYYLSFFHTFLGTEWGQLAASGLIVGSSVLCSKIWMRHLLQNASQLNIDRRRQQLVWAKNLIALCCLLALIGVWAADIAKFALSLAAVAGATLIVSKELLMCGMGYLLINLSRPYRIGDFIEAGGASGRVIDIDVFSTTLAETGVGQQLTGKTLSFPNSVVLSQPVRNSSATGEYIVDLYKIVVPFDVEMQEAETAALKAANDVAAKWQDEANRHFRRIADVAFLDLPSSRSKVLWASTDAKQHALFIRFACPMASRVTAEQEIFRRFWSSYRLATSSTGTKDKALLHTDAGLRPPTTLPPETVTPEERASPPASA